MIDFTKHEILSLDLETHDPLLKTYGASWRHGQGGILGYAVATPTEDYLYTPLVTKEAKDYLKDLMRWSGSLVGHNFKYDLGWLVAEGYFSQKIHKLSWDEDFSKNGRKFCTKDREAMIYTNARKQFSLNASLERRAWPTKKEDILLARLDELGIPLTKGEAPQSKLHLIHEEDPYDPVLAEYAEYDALMTMRLFKEQESQIEKFSLRNISELESLCLPIFTFMEVNGIDVDTLKMAKLVRQFSEEEEQLKKELFEATGDDRFTGTLTDADREAVAVLLESIGYKVSYLDVKPTKSNPEGGKKPKVTDVETKQIDHPLVDTYRKLNQIQKLRGKFLIKPLKQSYNGKIYPRWNQLQGDEGGTVTGRPSMVGINLLNQPGEKTRDESKPPDWSGNWIADRSREIRRCYKPKKGQFWLSVDFAGQEPRIMASLAARYKVTGWLDIVTKFKDDPKLCLHTLVVYLLEGRTWRPGAKKEKKNFFYKKAKEVNLGLPYGMGKARLVARLSELGMQEEEARALLGNYFRLLPVWKNLADACKNLVQMRGYSSTFWGRKVFFDKWQVDKFGTQRLQKLTDKERDALPKEALDHSDAVEKYQKEAGYIISRAFDYKALNYETQGSAADQTKAAMARIYYRHFLVPLLNIYDELCYSIVSNEQKEQVEHCMETVFDDTLSVPVVTESVVSKEWAGDSYDLV